MLQKTKHTEKFVHIDCICLKAPRWEVIRINNEMSEEIIANELAKPIEYQNPHLIDYHRQAIRKRKNELKNYRHIFN